LLFRRLFVILGSKTKKLYCKAHAQ